jgi:hydrogenase maturation protein HypF
VTEQDTIVRNRYIFRGIIQGVGFRPTVYRCASTLGLTGFVRNQRSEVLAEVQGPAEAVGRFPEVLAEMLPPAAQIDSVESHPIEPVQEAEFRIVESAATSYNFPPIPPDLALCADCRRELLDPGDRRYLYPFITCTQCGPRYSVVEDTPFDRETTSMVDFPQCPQCLEEYSDPMHRRFHAQTNACAVCGPRPALLDAGGAELPGDPLREAVEALGRGRVVAVKGLGGFHLAADPQSAEAMRRLRQDKERERKPFAIMVADTEEAQRLGELSPLELELLSGPASPILIVPRRKGTPDYLDAVSDTGTLGIMLPYTPLHLLLLRHPETEPGYRSLVMTSGNLKGEPIITETGEALAKLSGVADLFLVHDRRILFRTDDSVVRVTSDGTEVLLRRSRGYVPRLVSLGAPLKRTVLAVGGDLKNAPALGRGRDVHLAPYIGDLEDPLTRRDFERQIEQILGLYGTRPELVACDLHPSYHSSRWARELRDAPCVEVQHHHAHILSVMAEHDLEESLGLSFDGTGYGPDGTIWGGEFLLARRDGFERLGWFDPFRLPGGEAAIRNPLRIALALLWQTLEPATLNALFCSRFGLPVDTVETLTAMVQKGLNAPLTSSLGRLFDAAAALLGLVERVSYEGEGPIRLEGLALQSFRRGGALPLGPLEEAQGTPVERAAGGSPPEGLLVPLRDQGNTFTLDARPLLAELAARSTTGGSGIGGSAAGRPGAGRPPGRRAEAGDPAGGWAGVPLPPGVETGELALLFHRAVAAAALEGARWMRRATGLRRIALSGGVFQNVLLQELLVPGLRREGFEVYRNRSVPPGDGGIALGQVYFLPGNL